MQYPAATWIDVMVHAILSVLRSAASPEVRKIWIYAQGDKETFLNLRLGDRVGDKGGDTKKDEEWSLLCERLAESVASTLSVSTDRSLLRRSFPSERTTKGVVALAGLPEHWNEALLLHAAMAAGVALPEDRYQLDATGKEDLRRIQNPTDTWQGPVPSMVPDLPS